MNRLSALRSAMQTDLVFITKESDVSWLTGFSGDSSQALVGQTAAYFFTDSRYTEQAEKQLSSQWEIISCIDRVPGPVFLPISHQTPASTTANTKAAKETAIPPRPRSLRSFGRHFRLS